ncbi:MAG: polysaccharide deacetylase family protein [Planctomycetes bacterium]|nr:polysaccharide deacetylase family protein [Planctomycetota bacterium]
MNRLVVSCRNFADQMAWLSEHARVQSEARFLAVLGERPLARKPRVLITFDDGYADNVAHALPILRRYGHAALLFVTSASVDSPRLFWWDALDRIVAQATHAATQPQSGALTLPAGAKVLCTAGFDDVYAELLGILKQYDAQQRDAALDTLASQCGIELKAEPARRPATADELRAWCAAGMHVGAHTCTHARLAALGDEDVHREISQSKRDLEQALGVPLATMAYPFGGREDFDQRAERAAETAGYRCAFANWNGNVRWARSRFALPRCLVRDWPVAEFVNRFEEWCQ